MQVDLLTFRIISVALTGCFAIGLPAVILGLSYFKTKADAQDLWFYSPLVGAGLVILICQNLLYLDVPMSKSGILVWLLVAAGWTRVLSSTAMRAMLVPVPLAAIGLGVAVYLVHGSGLLELGASNYYGYGWYDMFNYVSLAQFFADFLFHSTVADHGFLQAAQFYKVDRIGQSVLHAFLMLSSGADAQQSFGPTILLAPYLMFFAFLALARRFAPLSAVSYLAALAGALCPAVATVHLECFLSQAMCVPFLLVWPSAVGRLIERPGWFSALVAGALLAVVAAIYTEMMPIAVAVAIFCVIAKHFSGLRFVRSRLPATFMVGPTARPLATLLSWLSVAILVMLVANLECLAKSNVFSRLISGPVFDGIYPWAYSSEGIARLWLGDQIVVPPEWIVRAITGGTFLIVICNIIGLACYGMRSFSTFFLALVMLMLVPLGPLIVGNGSQFSYQFYKLLLMVWPLHVFWLVMGTSLFNRYRNYAFALGFMLASVNACLVFSVTSASAKASTVASTHRGGAHLLMDPDFRGLRRFLEATRDRDVLTLWFDREINGSEYRTAWMDYFGRNNRVLSLVDTRPTKADVADTRAHRLNERDLLSIPSAILITWKAIDGMKDRLVFANSLAFVYQTSSQAEMKRILMESRITISRKLRLDADGEIDPARWYPVWVAGEPGSASLLTMKFGEFNEFRYDQWGYAAATFKPGGNCRGKTMELRVQFMQPDRRLRLICNGATSEADIPLSSTRLQNSGPVRFGWNAGMASLEGKYPLAESFPGTIQDTP